MSYSEYHLYGHTYRYYRPNKTHWCLDVSRHQRAEGQSPWEIICYDADRSIVRAALLDVICTPHAPLAPDTTYTAIITGRTSPRECAPHADTLKGHGFTYHEPQIRPAYWAKPGCDFAALNHARALAASLGLKYQRRADPTARQEQAA
jgi:hypothetical protein